MPVQLPHRALYAAFDRYPSAKGAATHIRRAAATLFDTLGDGLLYVLGGDDLPVYQREDQVEILRFALPVPNVLERAVAFGARLSALLDEQEHSLQICHFRDPWSGVPILSRPGRRYKTVYEINGLPSIELPSLYPRIAPRTLEKLRAAERFCWEQADRIVTPAHTIRDNLVALGVAPDKIQVVPNGADLSDSPLPPSAARKPYLLYFGALQPWQGVDILLRSLALLADLDIDLVVCVSSSERQSRPYQRLAERLGLADRVVWQFQLSEEELAPWRAHALLSVAPLTECARNLAQGCCPLKVLESMAAGVPIVASDLPAIREIVEDGVDGRLVRPGRPSELARAVRVLLEYPEELRAMGARGRSKVEQSYTWQRAAARLAELYHALAPASDVQPAA